MIRTIPGNILDARDRYLVHQCNCLTTYAKGLADLVFARFPYADIYAERLLPGGSTRDDRDRVGSIIIRGDGTPESRFVVNLMGQVTPGKPKPGNDSAERRLGYFARALRNLEDVLQADRSPDKSVAFPFQIGCGLAGGSWTDYEAVIAEFSKRSQANVTIYRLPS